MPEASALSAQVASELAEPVLPGVEAVADAIRRRHAPAVAAVLFYGSCLRRGTTEGVLDFYVVVDGYRRAGSSWPAALLGTLLPPNVHYLEVPAAGGTLRAKYALVTSSQLLRGSRPGWPDCRIWVRFCQPARCVFARDEQSRNAVVRAVARSILTAVEWMWTWLPGQGSEIRFEPARLWLHGFRETYRTELRAEQPGSVEDLYRSQAARFDRVAVLALRSLAASGRLRLRQESGLLVVEANARRRRARRLWPLRRALSKALAALGLLKTPLTFEGWAPYALWKLERHTGVHVNLTPRQERWPLVFGWPVIWRVLRERRLR